MNLLPFSPFKIRLFGLMLFLCAAERGVFAAPQFVLSGRTADLQKVVLAEDETGPVTALDVLFYADHVRRVPTIDTEEWLAKGDERDPRAWVIIRNMTLEYLVALDLARQGGHKFPEVNPKLLEAVQRGFLYTAAEAVWTEKVVAPQVAIQDVDINRYYIAHPELFSSTDRAQVRYIFLPVEDMTIPENQNAALRALDAIRNRIVSGELTFGEAARQFSKAPSAADGGLVPEFKRGTFFSEFEFQAFTLDRPGRMSPVFLGNGGAYLLQLVSETKPEKIPIKQVEGDIRQRLSGDLIASYYRFLGGRLMQKVFVQDLTLLWPYADLSSPVVSLGNRRLTRDQVLRTNPQVINANYEVQWSVLQQETQRWVEGEVVLRDLAKRKIGPHPYLAQGTRTGETLLQAQPVLERKIDPKAYSTTESALRTLGLGAGSAAEGVPESRVIRITLIPAVISLKELGRGELTRQTLRNLTAEIEKGVLPVRPEPVKLAETLSQAQAQGSEGLATEIAKLGALVSNSPFTDVEVKFEDIGWKNALPILAWHPSLGTLRPGETSGPQPIGDNIEFYYVAASRLNKESAVLAKPALIRSLAHDVERGNVLKQEIAEMEKKAKLRF